LVATTDIITKAAYLLFSNI